MCELSNKHPSLHMLYVYVGFFVIVIHEGLSSYGYRKRFELHLTNRVGRELGWGGPCIVNILMKEAPLAQHHQTS